MIRRLTERDRSAALALLRRSPIHNLYMISNIEQLGFDAAYNEFWGEFESDDSGPLRGILNRYMTGWSVYGGADASWKQLADLIDRHEVEAKRLQDNPGGTGSLVPYLQSYRAEAIREEELMVLSPGCLHPIDPPVGYTVRRASMDDLEPLCDLYAEAGSMQRSRAAVKRPLRDLRVWVAAHDGRICSAALTNAEVENAAMVGGVYTPPRERNHGLSQAVCSSLCRELLDGGKQPVLYWQEPAAGAVYRKLGFRVWGVWRSVWLRRDAR